MRVLGLLLVTAVVALAEQQSAPPWFLSDVPVLKDEPSDPTRKGKAAKPSSQPDICSANGAVCLARVSWWYDISNNLGIGGVLENRSGVTLPGCSVVFTLRVDDRGVGTALGVLPAEIPSGDKWNFHALPMVATLSKSAYADAVTVVCGQARETINFDRRWSPTAFWAKRAWERQEKKRKTVR